MKIKNIGIIGAGNVGNALALQFTKAGHSVKVANSRGPESLKEFEKYTGAKAIGMQDLLEDIDILFIAIPFGNVLTLKPIINSLSEKTIVVDTGNYVPQRDGIIEEIQDGYPETAWMSKELQHPLVKAFNNIIANGIIINARPQQVLNKIALPISGNDPRSKNVIMTLINEIGITSYDAGGLEESWRQQPGQPAYCTDPSITELNTLLSKALPSFKARENQDKAMKLLAKIPQNFPSQDLVRASRLSVGLDLLNLKSWRSMIKLGITVLKK